MYMCWVSPKFLRVAKTLPYSRPCAKPITCRLLYDTHSYPEGTGWLFSHYPHFKDEAQKLKENKSLASGHPAKYPRTGIQAAQVCEWRGKGPADGFPPAPRLCLLCPAPSPLHRALFTTWPGEEAPSPGNSVKPAD